MKHSLITIIVPSVLLFSCASNVSIDKNLIKDKHLLDLLNGFDIKDDYLWKNPGETHVVQTKPYELSLIDGHVWKNENNSYNISNSNSVAFNTYCVDIKSYDDEFYVLTIPDKIKKELISIDLSINQEKINVNKQLIDGLFFKSALFNNKLKECKWYKTNNLNDFLSLSNNVELILKSKPFKLIKNVSKNELIEEDCILFKRDIRRRKNLSKDFGSINLERFKEWEEIESGLDCIEGKYLLTGSANCDINKRFYYYSTFLGGSIEPLFKKITDDNTVNFSNQTCQIIEEQYGEIYSKYFEKDNNYISFESLENCINELYENNK